MKCRLRIHPHASDQCVERGISEKELNEALIRGAKRKTISLSKLRTKNFINYKRMEVICISKPCKNSIQTVYVKSEGL